MKKSVWIGAGIGLFVGIIALLNLNNLFGIILIYPFLFIYNTLTGACSGNLCDAKLYVLKPFIKFIPVIYVIIGGLVGLIIDRKKKK